MPMMSDYEEDLDHFPEETETNWPNHWLEHIAQSPQFNGQHPMELL